VLGVAPGATRAEVTAAFRRFALRNHPDRGGDPDHFRSGVEAYRRLLGAQPRSAGAGRAAADVVFHRHRRAGLGALLRRARLTVARPRP
jgi:hypothetical protein